MFFQYRMYSNCSLSHYITQYMMNIEECWQSACLDHYWDGFCTQSFGWGVLWNTHSTHTLQNCAYNQTAPSVDNIPHVNQATLWTTRIKFQEITFPPHLSEPRCFVSIYNGTIYRVNSLCGSLYIYIVKVNFIKLTNKSKECWFQLFSLAYTVYSTIQIRRFYFVILYYVCRTITYIRGRSEMWWQFIYYTKIALPFLFGVFNVLEMI